jgi:transposase
MDHGARLLRPERTQLCWDLVDLDSQLPPDHRARVVWSFVSELDLAPFHATIKAREGHAGRPASDPAVLLAVWLYATLEGVGSARALERLCERHAAYRWLCGGVPVNHDLLSAFRRDNGERLDNLLTQSLTSLIAEGLVTLDEVAIDGTKARARAGRGSMAGGEKLARIEALVSERIAGLKRALEEDPSQAEQQRHERSLRAAAQQAARVRRAREQLAIREREKAERSKTHAKAEAAKNPPKVSTSDPQVRQMRLPDGSVRPAWNVQVATARGFIVGIEPTDRRQDGGLANGTIEQIERRCGAPPLRLLADGAAITRQDIIDQASRRPGMTIYSPAPKERENVKAETLRKRASQRRHEAAPVRQWRERMASETGKAVYRRRKLTEHAHAKMKNRGFGQMLVHGLAKVRCVCLFHAIAQNLLNAHRLRQAAP